MNRELIMTTLLEYLTGAPMVFAFEADLMTGSAQLANVSDTSGLFVGMPVTGEGIPAEAVIATVTPNVTLSLPAAGDITAAPLLQGFQTVSRRLRDASAEQDMPALYLVETNEQHGYRDSARSVLVELSVDVFVYTKVGADENAVPAAMLNTLIDSIERALYPPKDHPGGRRQNLGLAGVHYCRIEGEVAKDAGHDGALAMAVVPIKIAVAQHIDTVAYP